MEDCREAAFVLLTMPKWNQRLFSDFTEIADRTYFAEAFIEV